MRIFALAATSAALLSACAATEPVVTIGNGGNAPPVATIDSGIDKSNFDTSVRPQDDFYRYVDGTWLKNHPVPADKSNYGAFSKLADDAEKHLREIIEAAAQQDSAPGSDTQKVGDYYKAFMDAERADALGLKPLADELARIDAIQSHKALAAEFAHLSKIGVAIIPGFVDSDAKNSSQYMVYLVQGGTGLPDRDYYLEKDPKFAEIRTKYEAHIGNMFKLAGMKDSAAQAKAVMALETTLARDQWNKVDSRDADKTYNKYAFADLPAVMPDFDWKAFIDGTGIGKSDGLVLAQPSFFKSFDKTLKKTKLSTLRAWMKWNLLSSYAPYLSKPFVDENFAFYGTTLQGISELKPRWKRAVDGEEAALGEVLGRIYVAKYFPPEAKARMQTLVHNLIKSYEVSIKELDWMSEDTKLKALDKLSKFTPKIGYPDKWKDYSKLVVKPDDLVGNVMRSNAVEHDREVAKLGGPIDRSEWHMTPQTVNAYYNPGMNEIVFPAAILQPPFFDMKADDAANYGGIGAVIGHEIGHGFDDQGSKYDGDGNLKSWWTDADRKRFEAKTKALIAQYDGFEALPGHHVNGAFTIGENSADLGGLTIAYKAYHIALDGKPAPVIDGLTGDQRLFMGWAQVWRRNYKEANLLWRITADPHSPSEFRCNGIVRNLPAWYAAFDVKPTDKMYLPPDQRVKIW